MGEPATVLTARTDPDRNAGRRDAFLIRHGLLLSILVALVADFPWGSLQGHTHWARVEWIPFAAPRFRPLDIIANVLLFVPLGFFGARRRSSLGPALALVSTISIAVAFLGESIQLFSHGRFPSATDLVCNVGGGVFGGVIATLAGRRRSRFIRCSQPAASRACRRL
jgi:glycopeptide antibiotics resistance protein